LHTRYHVTCIYTHPISKNIDQLRSIEFYSETYVIIIGYWLDMEIYVRVLVRSNIARRQERNINYAPERVHIFPYPTNNLFITYALLSQKT